MIEEGRVAIITGATGNLGSVVARELGEHGARLALLGTSSGRLERLANELKLPGDRLLIGAFDLAAPGAAQEAASAVLAKFGRADILLHLVGGWMGGKPVAEVRASDVSEMLNQHLWTTFYLAQAFMPHFEANGWGRLIVVSSPYASHPPPYIGPYAVGKAAQEALVLALAAETAGSGVTANILQVRTIDGQHERDRQPTKENAHWTTPEEITAAILYLCSEEAHIVNGARIPLFGTS